MNIKKLLILALIPFFINSCALNRGIIDLNVKTPETQINSTGKTVFIRAVKDNRVFEENPANPATPSLGFGGSDKASEALEKRAIARKRNSFGKALGDIVLPEDKTVESVMRESIARSFTEMGYKVLNNESVTNKNTLIIDVSIDKFWSWMMPGAWTITLTSEIEAKITNSNSNKTKTITSEYKDNFLAAGGKNWMKVMNGNLENFNNKTKESFAKE